MRPRAVAVAACLLAAACVTTYEDASLIDTEGLEHPEFNTAQTIPFGDPDESPQETLLRRFYGGIFARMQTAFEERDHETLFLLADRYDKPGLPDGVRERLQGYRALGRGLVFLEHAGGRATLRPLAPPGAQAAATPSGELPPIGQPLRFEFALPAGRQSVRLGGDDPIGFDVTMWIDDDFVDGGRSGQTKTSVQWVEEPCDLIGDEVLRFPIEIDAPAGMVVRRTIHLRVDLTPGYVQIDGQRVPLQQLPQGSRFFGERPLQQRPIAEGTWTQWPAGYEPIRARPLATLREALRLGDEKHYPHVYLGAVFTTGADREAAIALLIDQVRLGGLAQANVAMASLRAISGADIPVGDRERWLAWFDLRR